MATKKCPKCGEENPAEAVMCWACYTPLAGGAAAVAGGGLVTPRGGQAAVTPAATAAAGDEEKTPVDPKIFLVAGLLLGAIVIGGFTTGLFNFGGSPEVTPTVTTGPGGQEEMPFEPAPAPPPVPAPPFPTTTGGGTTGGGTTGTLLPVTPPFRTLVPPDPRYSNGTAAILASSPTLTPQQAKGLAQIARQRFAPGGRWSAMQIMVFNNESAGRAFQKYQAKRKGAKLTSREYAELAQQGVWSSVPAYYESQGRAERVYQPSANPTNWWTSIRR